MAYDLVIKNGWVVDGSGLPAVSRRRRREGRPHRQPSVASVNRRSEVIDAEGQVVSPGFVDGHTHMDAQVFWDPLGTSSCWHGITTVVMGNCGFTLAPCAKEDRHLVIRNLQRAEDISARGDGGGHRMDVDDLRRVPRHRRRRCPRASTTPGYMGHSALRTYVMGERAFDEPAHRGRSAVRWSTSCAARSRAGAIGFTTSRSPSHETPDRRPVASRMASWDEVRRLVGVMGDMNAGIFELAGEGVDRDANNPDLADYHRRLRELAVETGRPITFGLFSRKDAPEAYKAYVKLLDDTAAAGRTHDRAGAQPRAVRSPVVQDAAPVRSPSGVEGAPRAPARRAEAPPPRPRAAEQLVDGGERT